jgi:uncharacterized protein (TIGR02145 family)
VNLKNRHIHLITSGILVSLLISSCELPASPDFSNKFDDQSDLYLPPPVVDVEGNIYQTVKIGKQIWMAENLRVSRYQNGTTIPNMPDSRQWYGYLAGAWAVYNNQGSNNTTIGKLYNYSAATDSRGICPTGWRLPAKQDWDMLVSTLGGFEVAGKRMKSTTGWDFNGNGTNSSGFNAKPGGFRWVNGSADDVIYTGIGRSGWWWVDKAGGTTTMKLKLQDYLERVEFTWSGQASGLSVRCVKN